MKREWEGSGEGKIWSLQGEGRHHGRVCRQVGSKRGKAAKWQGGDRIVGEWVSEW
jgi:hypothetical protein